MVGPAEAVTERLLCRRPGVTVADDYESLFTRPQVEAWLRPDPMRPFSRVDLDRMARRDLAHWGQHGFGPWEVREREGGAFVGRGGLNRTVVDGEQVVELPWAVMPAMQGSGYATEMAVAAVGVARGLGIDRVVSLTLPDNLASRRVMEKCGLEFSREIGHVGLPHVLYELTL